MRTSRALTAALAAGCGLLLAGCGSLGSTVTTSADKTGAGGAPKATAKPASVGDTITISGYNSEKIAVTLVKVVPNAKGADEFNQPDSGKVFVAVQLRIKDAASGTWSDSPDNCVVLRDASGQEFQPDFSTVTVGQGFSGSVNLASGSSVLGVEVFQVPKGDKPALLQFTTDSGMGPGTAQWSLS